MWKGFILLFVCLNFSVLGYSFCLSSMYCIFLSCISLFLHTFPQLVGKPLLQDACLIWSFAWVSYFIASTISILQYLDSLLQGRCSVLITKSGRAKWGWSFHSFLLAKNLPRLFSHLLTIYLNWYSCNFFLGLPSVHWNWLFVY